MLQDIKQMMLQNPSTIVTLLEKYDYCHIKFRPSEIRFARNEEGGQNISIRLTNNEGLYVKDFVTSDSNDVIGYIMKNRDVRFLDVLSNIKSILGLDDSWTPRGKRTIFGGFYDAIGEERSFSETEYPESVLDKYEKFGNKRWIRDGISLQTQRKYSVCYDMENDLIVFPWRSATSGAIIAVKARINYPQKDGGLKYWYTVNGLVSQSLFGYSENYDKLVGCEKLFVFESEKSVMVLDSWKMYNAVAIGSHSLSDSQARLIMSLDPKEVWFMLDKDLDLKETKTNIKTLKQYSLMKDVNIKYWDWTENKTVCEKGAPVDMGREVFEKICESEMREA